MDFKPLLEFSTDLAYRAGRIALGYFNTGVRPDFKSDDTPVTAADKAVEEFIRDQVGERYPDHTMVGEEFGEKGGQENPFRWIVDPIDGTKSFMRGVPLFGVLVALEVEGQICVGTAYFPALDEMLTAADGLGCWWNGRRAGVSSLASLGKACICYTTYKNFERRDAGVFDRLSKAAYMMRGWSDAYGYLLVATGRSEAMLDPYMHIWDCGPFPVILREAGGYFGSWQGEPGHVHGEGLACNAALKSDILQVLHAR